MSMQENLVIDNSELDETDSTWMVKALVIGGTLGALTGLGAAYLFVQRAKKGTEPPSLTAMEGVKLALLVFGLLRSVAMLGGGDEK
jgi:predicted metalloendopeptidase